MHAKSPPVDSTVMPNFAFLVLLFVLPAFISAGGFRPHSLYFSSSDGLCLPVVDWDAYLVWNPSTEFVNCTNAVSCNKGPVPCEEECKNALRVCEIGAQSRSQAPDAYECLSKMIIGRCTPECLNYASNSVVCGHIVLKDAVSTTTEIGVSDPETTTTHQASQPFPWGIAIKTGAAGILACVVAAIAVIAHKNKWETRKLRGLSRMINHRPPDPVASFLAQEAKMLSQTTSAQSRDIGDDCLSLSSPSSTRTHTASPQSNRSSTCFTAQTGGISYEMAVMTSSEIAAGFAVGCMDSSSSSSESSSPRTDRMSPLQQYMLPRTPRLATSPEESPLSKNNSFAESFTSSESTNETHSLPSSGSIHPMAKMTPSIPTRRINSYQTILDGPSLTSSAVCSSSMIFTRVQDFSNTAEDIVLVLPKTE